MKQRLHPIEIALMLAAALILTSGAVALHTQSELADKVVRLHVLANSDSEEDQAMKLKVRDAVLARAAEALEGTESREEACRRLTDILPELEKTAKAVISANGYDYGVRAELAETAFPTKDYNGFSLPGNIWRCGCSSEKRRGRTGGVWCSHLCAPPQPATFRRWPWTPG